MGERMKKKPAQEMRPDGWERFERAVDAAIKSGPKHKAPKTSARRSAAKKPAKKRKQGHAPA